MHQAEHSEPVGVGLCSICGDRADGYHYGVLSCRGCNAFFRRAVAFNLQFHCRREGRCEINKNARCACRACRLQKCRDVGMDPSAVQVRREVKDVLGLDHRGGRNDFPPIGSDHAQPSIASVLSVPVYDSAKMLDSHQLKSRLLGSITSSVAHSPRIMHPLDRLVEWYFCQRYRRSSMLCQTVEQILDSMAGPPETSRISGQATPEELKRVNKVQMVMMFEWVEQLEEFEQLEDPMDKTRLLRAFALKYLVLDTILCGLEQGFADRIVLPNGTSIHRSDRFRQISPPFGSDEDEVRWLEAVEMMHGEGHLLMIEELIQPLADMQVTFGEFMTLRLLLFWDPEVADNSNSVQGEIIRNASGRALIDLQSWYEVHSVGIGGGQRLEDLLLFLPVIKKYAEYLHRITAHIADFAVMSEWQFIADLVIA